MMDMALIENPKVGERMNTRGVDWGPNGIILVHREGQHGVYKIPGHKTWGGNFEPWYYTPTRYGICMVYAREHEREYFGHAWGTLDLLYQTEITPGSAWRAALKVLKYEVGKLDAGDEDTLEYLGV